MAQLDAIGGSSEAGEYYSGRPPMILIVSSWSPPSSAPSVFTHLTGESVNVSIL
jgi:hypothetical protein